MVRLAVTVAALLLGVQAAVQPVEPVNVQFHPHGTLSHPDPRSLR